MSGNECDKMVSKPIIQNLLIHFLNIRLNSHALMEDLLPFVEIGHSSRLCKKASVPRHSEENGNVGEQYNLKADLNSIFDTSNMLLVGSGVCVGAPQLVRPTAALASPKGPPKSASRLGAWAHRGRCG